MEWLHNILKTVEPAQYIYGIVAVFGGVARYLNSFASGAPFKITIFFASAFVSGFSGWMFAQIGISIHATQEITFIMAGTGGFMGEQAMKYLWELLQKRTVILPK